MPIYEYKCPNGHLFELWQGFTDPEPDVCEECGEGPVRRVLFPVAVHFKGSGFYSTDYGRGSRKRDAAKEGGGEGGGSGDGGAKKDEPKPQKAAEGS